MQERPFHGCNLHVFIYISKNSDQIATVAVAFARRAVTRQRVCQDNPTCR